MKKLSILLVAVLLAVSLIPLAACGETEQYKEFYDMVTGLNYEVTPPDGYEYVNFHVAKHTDYIEFYANTALWSASLYVYGNPENPLVFWYREVYEEGSTRQERILMLNYQTSTATPELKQMLISSQSADDTHPLYAEVLQNAQQAYDLLLPIVNDLASQLSNGKYNSIDQLRIGAN